MPEANYPNGLNFGLHFFRYPTKFIDIHQAAPGMTTHFRFTNTFATQLPGFYLPWHPERSPSPRWVKFNHALAEALDLDATSLSGNEGLAIFSGNALPAGATPLVQAYAGHQFGGFNPKLGDGRAVLLGEVINRLGIRQDIQLKGAGQTPYSRSGDGKAALGPMLREYLIGEAMHHLGIPTSRALAVVTSGESVYRDTELPGAILTRVAQSHIRIGTFEYYAVRERHDLVRQLADYTLERHYPELHKGDYRSLLRALVDRQSHLVAQWMGVGFIHGVMNTDNVTLSGETLDYGPCAFLEHYDPAAVFSSIDRQGRYAFGNQPAIMQWNLARFAESLLHILSPDPNQAIEIATQEVQRFSSVFEAHWLTVFRKKLGLQSASPGDHALATQFLKLLQLGKADHTLAWRSLSKAIATDASQLLSLFTGDHRTLDSWLQGWRARLAQESVPVSQIKLALQDSNPWVIPRNHLVEAALDKASAGDLSDFDALLNAVSMPYQSPQENIFTQPSPPGYTAAYRTYCGT